jgi:hypothetical protein
LPSDAATSEEIGVDLVVLVDLVDEHVALHLHETCVGCVQHRWCRCCCRRRTSIALLLPPPNLNSAVSPSYIESDALSSPNHLFCSLTFLANSAILGATWASK